MESEAAGVNRRMGGNIIGHRSRGEGEVECQTKLFLGKKVMNDGSIKMLRRRPLVVSKNRV